MANKKLIEVALPLEKINAESSREKTIRNGHPSNLHLWWARRPLTAARAVIWSSLVDDPSSHTELFPTEEAQTKERQRLFKILEELVLLENSNNEIVLERAKDEIKKYVGEEVPILLDPFSGGGAIPIEAQRLGLEAVSHDLNPVPITINKAMTDIPYRFSNGSPINPESRDNIAGDTALEGLKALSLDISYYSEWMLKEAKKKLIHLYPSIRGIDGDELQVISWIWTRTVKCPNPACECEMPLASSFVISKKKGNEAWVEPVLENGKIKFNVHKGKCPKGKESPKLGKKAIFKCPICGEATTDEYVKRKGKNHEIGMQLMAIAADGKCGREYYPVPIEHILAANVNKPIDYPEGEMPHNPRWFSPPGFGMTNYSDIFTNRQMIALTTFSDLVSITQNKVEDDAVNAGYANDHIPLAENGTGARAYGEAIGVYLAFLVDKLASLNTSICPWEPVAQCPRTIFGRQAIPMVWDFAESNPIGASSGSFKVLINGFVNLFESGTYNFPREKQGIVKQHDAQSDCGMRNIMVSTDPPYYDNIGYADLSDFFYIWLRRSLKTTFPDLYKTMLVPKAEELIATPYRHEGSMEKAKEFFEDGMLKTCKQIYKYSRDDIPVTIYYAYKQSDTKENNTSSSGWETMLSAIVRAGFAITGTWPMRTEMTAALKANVNALATSVVLVCRKRSEDAQQTTRRNFINVLKRELRPALQKLQKSNIAPVDLAQSAIGPGMGVFSRYSKVVEADGTAMTVRSALQVINQELDLYFNEQDGELDRDSRFCIDVYSQYAFNEMKFGDADTLSRAKNTSVASMAGAGLIYAQKGTVHLLERNELADKTDGNAATWLLCQQLTRSMELGGIEACAKIVAPMYGTAPEKAKDLAYRLYTIAERKGWSQEAYAYNALVVSWPEIQSRAAAIQAVQPKQLSLFDM